MQVGTRHPDPALSFSLHVFLLSYYRVTCVISIRTLLVLIKRSTNYSPTAPSAARPSVDRPSRPSVDPPPVRSVSHRRPPARQRARPTARPTRQSSVKNGGCSCSAFVSQCRLLARPSMCNGSSISSCSNESPSQWTGDFLALRGSEAK